MTRASYIVRLDDACPTMAPESWCRLEAVFEELAIRPLVAVIPDCRDPEMALAPPDPDFWRRVRAWQDKGWGIALHGLHHHYHRDPSGHRSLVPFKREGEFVGIPAERQREMIRQAWNIFVGHGVTADFFIAPSHSFDRATLEALRSETPIRKLSDGLSWRPFRRFGFVWYPQQLWHFRDMPRGLWTICLHPNTMTPEQVQAVIEDLRRFAGRIVAPAALPAPGGRGISDLLFETCYRAAYVLKRRIRPA